MSPVSPYLEVTTGIPRSFEGRDAEPPEPGQGGGGSEMVLPFSTLASVLLQKNGGF